MTTETLEIRQLPLDHPDGTGLIAQVQEYYTQIYGGPDDAPADTTEFAPPTGRFYLGYLGAEAVVMGGWRFHSGLVDIPARRPAEIKRMYVVPPCRGRGLARRLLDHLERSAADAGADAMVLETGQRQPDAVGLYRANGYTDVPAFGYYADAPGAVHLGKVLPQRS